MNHNLTDQEESLLGLCTPTLTRWSMDCSGLTTTKVNFNGVAVSRIGRMEQEVVTAVVQLTSTLSGSKYVQEQEQKEQLTPPEPGPKQEVDVNIDAKYLPHLVQRHSLSNSGYSISPTLSYSPSDSDCSVQSTPNMDTPSGATQFWLIDDPRVTSYEEYRTGLDSWGTHNQNKDMMIMQTSTPLDEEATAKGHVKMEPLLGLEKLILQGLDWESRVKEEQPIPQISFSPENFIIYPRHHFFYVNDMMTFYFEATGGFILQKQYFFSVKLKLPTGILVSLTLCREDKPHGDRYYCSFVPTQQGRHILYITLTSSNDVNVCGSPYEVFVTRDYRIAGDLTLTRIGFDQWENRLLNKPWGIAVFRPRNWIYVADRHSHSILRLDAHSRFQIRFGMEGNGPGQLFRPTGIAVDDVNMRVYVTDKDNHRVCMFGLDGAYLDSFGENGHGNGQFNYPWGIAVSPNGHLIAVTDSRNHCIQLFDKDGGFLRKFTVYETNPYEYKQELDYPRGIVFNNLGTKIYVSDFNTHNVYWFNVDLTTKTTFISDLHRPQGLAVDEAGNIIVVDTRNNCIRVYTPQACYLGKIDGTGDDCFNMPMDIAILKGGAIAVIDGDCRLRIF